MSKIVYIKRKEGDGYRGADGHYLRDVKNISEIEEAISTAITEANFPHCRYFMAGEGQDAMWRSDYVVLVYNKKKGPYLDFFLYKLELETIFSKEISYRHIPEVDGEPLSSQSLFSGHQDKIEF